MQDSNQDRERSALQKATAPFLLKFIATGAFVGYAPRASGTAGTLLGLAIYLLPGFESPVVLLPAIAAGILIGAFAAHRVAQAEPARVNPDAAALKSRFQGPTHTTPDPSIVVIDEIVGMWVSVLFLPKTFMAVSVAFLAFRLFDVIKPQPARRMERLPNGWGIVLDDVVAGIYANIVAQIVHRLAGGMFGS
jgi:phosphatidylglycerophosphatase A